MNGSERKENPNFSCAQELNVTLNEVYDKKNVISSVGSLYL